MKVIGCDEHPKQKEALMKFGEFLGLSEIYYNDLGKAEHYLLVKPDGQKAEIRTAGNQYDGGFMSTEVLP